MKRIIFGFSLYLVLGAMMAHAGQFLDAPQYTVGTNPQAVAYGDFNGDGKLDVAVVNTTTGTPGTISVLLGNGDGTFQAQVTYATGSSPFGIAVGDFNGDGKPDLAVTNSTSNTVSIFIGNGDGTFQAKQDYGTGNQPEGVAVGDFNGDGSQDLVVTNFHDGTACILFGKGNGQFNPPTSQTTYNTGTGPLAVVVGNFNASASRTNMQDFAVANKNTFDKISVFLNKQDGTGTFNTQLQYSTGGMPTGIAAADFNGDGNLDIAVSDNEGLVSILLGGGNGSFQAAVNYDTAATTTGVTVGDFNSDGIPDVAVSSGNGNTVSVLLGNGDGTFKAQTNFGVGNIPYSVISADFNGDGKADLIVANSGSASISVLLGNGDKNGTFQSRIDYTAGIGPNAVVVADFNGDGIPDIAVANSDCVTGCRPSTVSILLGNGDGSYQTPNHFSTGTNTNTYALAVGDLNGDKIPDLAVVNYATGTVSVLIGNGDGTFQTHVDYTVGSEPASVAIGDFNGDGHPDLVVSNFSSNNLSVLLNNGNGTFQAAVPYSVGHGPYSVATADFNGDGVLDLVVVNETDNNVSVLIGNVSATTHKGDGTFKAQSTFPTGVGGNPVSIIVGDFRGNGVNDLAVADYQTQEVSILLGNGNGTFQQVQLYRTGANPSSVIAGDFNGDGKLDLALASTVKAGSAGNLASVLYGNGDGTFGAPSLFPTGSQAFTEASSIAAVDLNGDSATDLVVANGLSSTVSVLLNSQGTNLTLSASTLGNSAPFGQNITFTANISASLTGSPTPTGSITFKNGSTVLGSAQTISNGQASISTNALPVGTNTISAVYTPDSNSAGIFQPHTVTALQAITQAGTTVSISSSINPSVQGQSVSFQATIQSGASQSPTGTINFFDGATPIGSGTVNASGPVMMSSSTLSVGTHSITASYSGDTNFTGSTSQPLNQVVNVVTAAFILTATPLTPSSIAAGSSSTSTITITPAGGLNPASVNLSCISISGPQNGPAPKCSFSAITVANGVGTSTLTVSTTGPTAALSGHTSLFYATWLLLPAAVLGSVFMPKPRGDKFIAFGLVFLLSAGIVFQSACGGGSNSGGGNTNPTKSASSTALKSSSATVMVGQPVTFTANVTSSASGTPTGTVTFADGSATLGTGTLSGGTATYQTSSLAAGTHNVTAAYGGDTNFNGSTSTAVSQTVDNAGTASGNYTFTVGGTAAGAPNANTGALPLTIQ